MTLRALLDSCIKHQPHSDTLLINQASVTRISQGEKIYKFGFGQSPFAVPDFLVEQLQSFASRKEYMPVQGDPELRRLICEFHKRLNGYEWQPESVIIGAGSKILLFCLLASFKQADVLIPTPSWVSYAPQAELAGHNVHWLETEKLNRWLLSADQLERYLSTLESPHAKLLILNTPSNPTGQYYNADELQRLAKVCRENDLLVISDEIYAPLNFNGDYESIARYYEEGVIVTSGLSKWCGAGGWRLGFCHIPEILGDSLLKAAIGIASETYSCAPAPIQCAARSAYERYDQAMMFINYQTRFLMKVNQQIYQFLSSNHVHSWPAMGGFYQFLDFSHFAPKLRMKGIYTASDLTDKLFHETGVALLPGSAFGMPAESLTARLAFVDFNGSTEKDVKKEGLDHMMEGLSKMIRWLTL